MNCCQVKQGFFNSWFSSSAVIRHDQFPPRVDGKFIRAELSILASLACCNCHEANWRKTVRSIAHEELFRTSLRFGVASHVLASCIVDLITVIPTKTVLLSWVPVYITRVSWCQVGLSILSSSGLKANWRIFIPGKPVRSRNSITSSVMKPNLLRWCLDHQGFPNRCERLVVGPSTHFTRCWCIRTKAGTSQSKTRSRGSVDTNDIVDLDSRALNPPIIAVLLHCFQVIDRDSQSWPVAENSSVASAMQVKPYRWICFEEMDLPTYRLESSAT